MKRYYLDTNFILRFFLGDVPSQYEITKDFFERAKRGELELIVCQAVILELDYILEKNYRLPRIETVTLLGRIVTTPYLKIEDKIAFQEGLIAFSHSSASLVDSFLFHKAQLDDAAVLSFDKDIKKTPGRSKS